MKTYIKNNEEAIIEALEEMSNEDIIQVHNIYCENNNDMDSQIFRNDEEFIEIFFNNRASEFQRACEYGDYKYIHEYVMFNGYANLESFNDPFDYVDIESIASDILENEKCYSYILELEEEEEEEL